MHEVIERLRGGLVVSCQALPDSPVYGPKFMAAFAACAERGGAVGVRVNGPADIRAVRRAVALPILGIIKERRADYPVYITPTLAAAKRIAAAGSDIIAIDATHRARPQGWTPERLIAAIHDELGLPVVADVDSFEEGMAAAAAGADIVATTMAGYTPARPTTAGPDLELLAELSKALVQPVICEGRIQRPEHVAAAFQAGAFSVVVGNAITNPIVVTDLYARAAPRAER